MVDQLTGKGAGRTVVEQNKHSRTRGWGFGAVRGKFQNGLNLFPRHTKFFHEFVNIHVLKIFEHRRNGGPSSPEYPCAATLTGDAFHGGTL